MRWADLVDPRCWVDGPAHGWRHTIVFRACTADSNPVAGSRWVLSDDVRAMRGKWPSTTAKPSSAESPFRPASRRGRSSFSRRRTLPNRGRRLCTGAEHKDTNPIHINCRPLHKAPSSSQSLPACLKADAGCLHDARPPRCLDQTARKHSQRASKSPTPRLRPTPRNRMDECRNIDYVLSPSVYNPRVARFWRQFRDHPRTESCIGSASYHLVASLWCLRRRGVCGIAAARKAPGLDFSSGSWGAPELQPSGAPIRGPIRRLLIY